MNENEVKEFMSIEDLVNETTKQIGKNIKEIIPGFTLETFRRYLEDTIIGENITYANYKLTTYGNGATDEVTPNVKASLIASGIRPNGMLKKDEKIEYYKLYIDRKNNVEAKEKAQQLEPRYLDNIPFGKKVSMMYERSKNHSEIVDPRDLVKIGVAMQDRMSGYVQDRSGNNEAYIDLCKDVWAIERNKYQTSGLTDTAYFKVLRDVFETNEQHHYPLISRLALESIASFTYKLDFDKSPTVGELQDMYRFNDASMVISEDYMQKYYNEISKSMTDYVSSHREPSRQFKR